MLRLTNEIIKTYLLAIKAALLPRRDIYPRLNVDILLKRKKKRYCCSYPMRSSRIYLAASDINMRECFTESQYKNLFLRNYRNFL